MSTLTLLDIGLAPAQSPSRARHARAFPRHLTNGRTLPVHYWLEAFKWSTILIAAMAVIYVLEKFVLGLKGTSLRMVADPSEMAVRFFGLSHYTVATYMLFTSKKLRNLRGVVMLGLFTLMAIGFCTVFAIFGGKANIAAVIAVFFFFLMHALRDEVFFYRMRTGKAISDEEYPHVYRMLIWLQVAGICVLAGLLYPAFIYQFTGSPSHAALDVWINALFPTEWPLGIKMLASSAPFLCVAAYAASKIQRAHRGGLIDLLMSHTPLSIILGSTVVVALSSVFIGTWVLNVVILMHFTGWFIWTTANICKQPREVQQAVTWRNPNEWIRQNLLGFWVFHGGLALMFFGLIAVNHWLLAQRPLSFHALELPNPLTALFCANSFFYWTIIHCTLGFLPKPKPVRR